MRDNTDSFLLGDLIDPSEIGCQINLITGEHYGECKGSCKSESDIMVMDNHVEKWEELAKIVIHLNEQQADDDEDMSSYLKEVLEGVQRIHKLSGEIRDYLVQTSCQETDNPQEHECADYLNAGETSCKVCGKTFGVGENT